MTTSNGAKDMNDTVTKLMALADEYMTQEREGTNGYEARQTLEDELSRLLIQPNYVRLEPYSPNKQGSTLCTVRWMAETVKGWVGAYDREALEQLVIKPECEAVQASDQMVCKCGNGWDVNDSHPPSCKATSHSYDLTAIKHTVVQELEYAKRTGVTSNISPITHETLLQMCLDLEKYKAKGGSACR